MIEIDIPGLAIAILTGWVCWLSFELNALRNRVRQMKRLVDMCVLGENVQAPTPAKQQLEYL